MKVLAVDPGDKRIGLAISDPTGTLARPLCVIRHKAREHDAKKIIEISQEEGAELILVGWALDSEGQVGHQARKSQRLANAIRENSSIQVEMWDESNTTQDAINNQVLMGTRRKKRKDWIDGIAACILLQDFLDQKSINDKHTRNEHG